MSTSETRTEKDPLGEKQVPADALFGIQTLRARENFPISGIRPLPPFVTAHLAVSAVLRPSALLCRVNSLRRLAAKSSINVKRQAPRLWGLSSVE